MGHTLTQLLNIYYMFYYTHGKYPQTPAGEAKIAWAMGVCSILLLCYPLRKILMDSLRCLVIISDSWKYYG